MDARLQRRVQRYGWDRAAASYETYWARQLLPAQSHLLALAALAPGEHVIDVACGTGLVTCRAADSVGPAGRVVGTDISDVMVARAADAATALGLQQQARFERCDAEALSLSDESFDAALCALGLMYVPDPVQALREMRRVLRPGGRAAVAVWGARERCGWAEIFEIVERRVASDVCPLFFQLGTGDALCWTLDAAELADIVVERLPTTLHYTSGDDACGAAFAGGPVALAYAHFDAATRAEAHAEYLESIAPFHRGEGYAIPGEFVVARATRA